MNNYNWKGIKYALPSPWLQFYLSGFKYRPVNRKFVVKYRKINLF